MLEGKVDSISAADWHVSELDMQLELTDAGLSGRLHIARIELPAAGLDLADTRIDCERVLLTATRFTCERGVLDANLPGIGRHRVAVQFAYDRRTGTTHITLPQLPVAGSNVRVRASVDDTTSTIHFEGEALQLEALVNLANAFGAGLDDLTTAGQAAVSGTLETRGDGSLKMSLNAQLLDASLANPAGTAVTDALRGNLALTALHEQAGWQIDASVTGDRGEVYFEPVYANLSEHAIELRATGLTTADFVSFDLARFHVAQQSLMTLDGKIAVTLPGDDTALALDGRIEFTDTSVAAVYSSLLQVLAAGTILGDLRNGRPRVRRTDARRQHSYRSQHQTQRCRTRRPAAALRRVRIAWPNRLAGYRRRGCGYVAQSPGLGQCCRVRYRSWRRDARCKAGRQRPGVTEALANSDYGWGTHDQPARDAKLRQR
ncbi:MAG: hypothetical protein U5K38_13790 [Woeseiaceae bacterium]|nr:hypothetical protein [Woeseiaceae bacterium]